MFMRRRGERDGTAEGGRGAPPGRTTNISVDPAPGGHRHHGNGAVPRSPPVGAGPGRLPSPPGPRDGAPDVRRPRLLLLDLLGFLPRLLELAALDVLPDLQQLLEGVGEAAPAADDAGRDEDEQVFAGDV